MRTILAAFLLVFALKSGGQPVVSAAAFTMNMGGGTAVIDGGFSVDWSIGESTIIETFYGENVSSAPNIGVHWNVTSGILQPFDATHLYSFLTPTWSSQELRVYPVPSPGKVFIEFRTPASGKLSIELYSQEGQVLATREFINSGNSVQAWDLSNRASGVYYFRILLMSSQGILLKQGTFTIQKIK
jgi:hypothetical protein